MAEGSSGGSNTILIVVVIGLVLFLLVSKVSSSIAAVNKSVKDTYTPGTAASAAITSLGPALGKFASSLFDSKPGYTAPTSSTPSLDQSADAAARGVASGTGVSGTWGNQLDTPSWASSSSSSAFSDDSTLYV